MPDQIADFPEQGMIAKWLKRPNLKGIAYELSRALPNVEAAAGVSESVVNDMLAKCGLSYVDDHVSLAASTVMAIVASKATVSELLDRQAFLGLAKRLRCETAVVAAFSEAAERLFQCHYEALIAAGPIDEERRTHAIDFGKSLGLSFDQTQRRVQSIVGPIVQARVREILEDTMLSPAEEESLSQLARRLGVNQLTHDAESERVFALARTRWQIRQGNLPTVDCPLMLKRGEVCHAVATATAYEERQRTVRAGYRGVSSHIRIARGVYLNAGSYRAMRTTEAYSFLLGTGHLVITNKRVLFSSDNKNIAAAIDSIVDWTLYSDGVELKRATGKPVTYVFGAGNGLFLETLVAARQKFIG